MEGQGELTLVEAIREKLAAEKERDRYKGALERIRDLAGPSHSPFMVRCTRAHARCIAAEALAAQPGERG